MDTHEVAKEYRITKWAHIIRARNESGLSIKAFCEGEGIRESVYYYWQRKLRETACERLTGMQTGTAETIAVAPGFAEVKMAEETAQMTLPGPENSGQVRIEANGIHITADETYPPGKLAVLLRELSRLC